jgi:hypothetical protein
MDGKLYVSQEISKTIFTTKSKFNHNLMSTQDYFIDKDRKVLCTTAASFPQGVEMAHKKLHSLFPATERRTFYGISYSDKSGNIIYKAAADQLNEGEATQLNLEAFIIRKGNYTSEILKDWRKDETSVGKTFRKLLSDQRIDKKGYCLEIYLNENDMRCLVPLDPSYAQKTPTSGSEL